MAEDQLSTARRCAILVAAFLCAVGVSNIARADGAPDESVADEVLELQRKVCFDAYAVTERLQQAGRLLEAAKTSLECQASTCPQSFRPHCVAKREEVERATPSIVVRYADDTGADRAEASVFVDDLLRANSLNGQAIALDPGTHRVRLIAAGRKDAFEQTVVVATGEKLRVVMFREAVFRVTIERHRPLPWSVPVSLSIGGAGAIGFAVFGSLSFAAYGAFDGCKARGACDVADRGPFITRRTLADVGLTVAVLGLVTGAVLYLTRPTVSEQRRVRVSIGPRGITW